jgi:hypothetical protein
VDWGVVPGFWFGCRDCGCESGAKAPHSKMAAKARSGDCAEMEEALALIG